MSVATFSAQLQAAVSRFGAKLAPMESKILKAVDGKIATNTKSIDSRIKNLETTSEVVYWYDNYVDEGEDASNTYVNPDSRPFIKLAGLGFKSRYHPDASGQLKCKFIAAGKKDVMSIASMRTRVSSAGSFYHVECRVPPYPKGTSAEIKLYEHDGTLIPFKGAAGCNKFTVTPLYTETILVPQYPSKPTYTVTGSFNSGSNYRCQWKGNTAEFARTVTARSSSELLCGAGPTKAISDDIDDESGEGNAQLLIFTGSTLLKSAYKARNVKYYVCPHHPTASVYDCVTTCAKTTGILAGQRMYNQVGTTKWTAPFCGYVSVVAVGGGSGGGTQWSSGGGGGGGLGYIKRYAVVKDMSYVVEVGRGGSCASNAGNTHSTDGGNSYFVNTGTCTGYGGNRLAVISL